MKKENDGKFAELAALIRDCMPGRRPPTLVPVLSSLEHGLLGSEGEPLLGDKGKDALSSG